MNLPSDVGPGTLHPSPPTRVEDEVLNAWAHARWADVNTREGLYGLRVGPNKPLGSQGFQKEERGHLRSLSRDRLLQYLRAQGFGVPEEVPEDECRHFWNQSHGRVWLMLWHVPSLKALLEANEEILVTSGWEHSTNESCRVFVERCRTENVRPCTALFDLIADAYGDKTGPGRTDVFPGVPYTERLAAFRRVHGFDDMTVVYGKIAERL